MERLILHSDMNNFYASVECLYDPSLRGKAIAVAGDPAARHGIVLAKSNEAKKFGVKTAEPLWQAKAKCPQIQFVPPHFDRYMKYSRLAREIYGSYTDQVEPFGLDEAWLDVTKSVKLLGSGREMADDIRRRIQEELGLTVSVGVSFNKIFAKLGSDLKKPDATTEIRREDVPGLVWPLPVQELLYVGEATRQKLADLGIRTIGELARADQTVLQRQFGKQGTMLWDYANGRDESPVARLDEKAQPKSIGNSTTTPRDLVTDEEIKTTLYVLCESVSSRLRERGLVCGTVALGVRDNTLHHYERQIRLEIPNRTAECLFETCFALYKQHHQYGKPVRLLSVRTTDLFASRAEQMRIFDDTERLDKREQLETVLDGIRDKYGHFAIQRGLLLADTQLSNINPKDDHLDHEVNRVK